MSLLARRSTPSVGSLRTQFFDPFEEVFNSFFDDFFANKNVLNSVKNVGGYPKMDIVEENETWLVRAAIPGMKAEDVKVEVLDGILRLSGRMSAEHKSSEKSRYHVRELHSSSFTREILLPEYVEGDPSAKYKDGILTLAWKRKIDSKPKPKVIEVKEE